MRRARPERNRTSAMSRYSEVLSALSSLKRRGINPTYPRIGKASSLDTAKIPQNTFVHRLQKPSRFYQSAIFMLTSQSREPSS